MELRGIPPLKQFDKLSHFKKVRHFISSRKGGISKGPYEGLNLGLHTDDRNDDVMINRTLLAEAMGFHPGRFVYARQAHTGHVAVINEKDAGKGFDSNSIAIPETDAMVTSVPGICLVVLVADCVPLLYYDPVKHVSAVAHAGWRGTLKEIARNTVNSMTENFGSLPGNIICCIGPSIGPCCYEVGAEVIREVNSLPFDTRGYLVKIEKTGKAIFDLWTANRLQLTEAGLKPENIEVYGDCTLCNSGSYFSSRAGKGITGRFAAGICLE